MKNLFRPLLLLIVGATQKELARQVRYLKVENEILRSKLPVMISLRINREPKPEPSAEGRSSCEILTANLMVAGATWLVFVSIHHSFS